MLEMEWKNDAREIVVMKINMSLLKRIFIKLLICIPFGGVFSVPTTVFDLRPFAMGLVCGLFVGIVWSIVDDIVDEKNESELV